MALTNSRSIELAQQTEMRTRTLDEKAVETTEANAYLIFQLHATTYGVKASAVREIFKIPELTPMEETPDFVAGVINLRGRVTPVVDLNMRIRNVRGRFRLKDSVIVVETDPKSSVKVGMIVNEVYNVIPIAEADIEEAYAFENLNAPYTRLISYHAKTDDAIIMLLNQAKLLTPERGGEAFWDGLDEAIDDQKPAPDEDDRSKHRRFMPDASPEERKILHDRALNLMLAVESKELVGLTPLAVVGLNGENFGVSLELVREFADLKDVTPIPCCPEHIIGALNLRGDLLTLIDIRVALNMPLRRATQKGKIIVINNEELQTGVWVDDVYDVIYIHPDDMSRPPAAVKSINNDHLKGMAPYRESMLTVIDLENILTQGDLVVDEVV